MGQSLPKSVSIKNGAGKDVGLALYKVGRDASGLAMATRATPIMDLPKGTSQDFALLQMKSSLRSGETVMVGIDYSGRAHYHMALRTSPNSFGCLRLMPINGAVVVVPPNTTTSDCESDPRKRGGKAKTGKPARRVGGRAQPHHVINPETGRRVRVGGATHTRLLRDGTLRV